MEHDDHHDDPPADEPRGDAARRSADEARPGDPTGPTEHARGDGESGSDAESDAEPGAGAPPERICRRCSTVAATTGEFCPHCGASYVRRRRSPLGRLGRRGRRVTIAVALLVLLGGGGAGAALKIRADDRAEQRERAAADRREAADRAARARQEREAAAAEAAQEAADEEERLQRRLRTFTVRELRKAVTKDARDRHAEGVLEDRARSTSCENTDGAEDDLTENSGEYSCIAVTETDGEGGSSGYRFTARVDFEEGSFTWRLGD